MRVDSSASAPSTTGDSGRRGPGSSSPGWAPLPTGLTEAFEDILVTSDEARRDQRSWNVPEDGLEPWLGEIRDVA